MSTSRSDGELPWLDWVRFMAALVVVMSHARGGLWVDWGRLDEGSRSVATAVFFAITRIGTEAVLVFFVLSGFLVGGRLLERVQDRSFQLRAYVVDRFTRIWIPLVPALAWSGLVAAYVGQSASMVDFVGNLLGLQGVMVGNYAKNEPLWSLSYEIWFYFLGGCAALWMTGDPARRLPALAGLAIGWAVFTQLDAVFLFAWLIGASTYWLVRHDRHRLLLVAGGTLVAIGYVLCQVRSATVSVDLSDWLPFAPTRSIGMLAFALGVALLLPALTFLAPASPAVRAWHGLGGRLAAFSYTMYLTHYPALYLWEHHMPVRAAAIDAASLGWYALRVVSCIGLAWILYLPFEKQTARVRRAFTRG